LTVVPKLAVRPELPHDRLAQFGAHANPQCATGGKCVSGFCLDPMSAQERRVVHEHLKDRAGVETYSEGDEPHRCVVVAPLVTE